MAARYVVAGQKVDRDKVQLAKELRRSMTPSEAALWKRLRGNRLVGLHFRRQQIIDGFIVDFYCHSAGLVVEVDGGVHDQQTEYDSERDRILKGRGLRVIRIRNEEISHNIEVVLAHIAAQARRINASCEDTEESLPSPQRGGEWGGV